MICELDELDELIRLMKNNEPFIFTKFGDGEYECASQNYAGKNCDGDNFTPELREGLRTAFVNLVKHGAFLGRWFEPHKVDFWENLITEKGMPKESIKWVDYHIFLMDGASIVRSKKIKLYSLIRSSKSYKILLRSSLLVRSDILLGIIKTGNVIEIPLDNWFSLDYERVKREIEIILMSEGCSEEVLLIMMGGMASKVLSSDILILLDQLKKLKKSKRLTIIDIGSGLDLISTKRDSRGNTSYEDMCERFESILKEEEEWDRDEMNKKYDYIYKEATNRLGCHK